MEAKEYLENPGRAPEIADALAELRCGLCGFDVARLEWISRILRSAGSHAVPFEERLLAEFASVCDVIVIRLGDISPKGLRAAAALQLPILATGPCTSLVEGAGGAYSWCRDFMSEPWEGGELLVRLFRLLQPPGGSQAATTRENRTAPLVLLADDDPELTTLADATLRNYGIVCRTAKDGLEALRLARELRPDLILLDVNMPKVNGFEVLKTIRSDYRLNTLRVMLLTGCDELEDVTRGSGLGAHDYLCKPVSPNLLINRVNRLLSAQVPHSRRWIRSSPDRRIAQWVSTGSPNAATREQG